MKKGNKGSDFPDQEGGTSENKQQDVEKSRNFDRLSEEITERVRSELSQVEQGFFSESDWRLARVFTQIHVIISLSEERLQELEHHFENAIKPARRIALKLFSEVSQSLVQEGQFDESVQLKWDEIYKRFEALDRSASEKD